MTAEQIMRQALDMQGVVPYIGKTQPMDYETQQSKSVKFREYYEKLQQQAELRKAEAEKKQILGYHRAAVHKARTSGPTYQLILSAVSLAHMVPVQQIISNMRARKIVDARHHAAWELIRRKRLTTVDVGKIMRRDHTTVVHSLQYVQKHMDHFTAHMQRVDQLLTTGKVA